MLETPVRLREALGDRYRLERELGAGGMATVYLATDLKHDREVALDDGTLLFEPWDTPESAPFLRLADPGRVTNVGRVPRSVGDVTFSGDLGRAAVLEVNRHGDAFMSKLVRR